MKRRTIGCLSVLLILTFLMSACSGKRSETMERAVRALEQTDYETAASLFDEVIGEGKDLQYAYRGKGIALMGMMEYAEAEEAFRTALDSEVWTDRFTYGDDLKKDIEQFLAVCCVRTGEYEEAIALYDTLIEEIGETPDLLTDRGTAKVGAGMITEAKLDFDRAINLNRTDYERILKIAQILDEGGAREIGTAYLSGVASLDSTQIDPVLKGEILYFLEDYAAAASLLEKAAASDENAALIRCKSFISMGDTEKALEVLDGFGSRIEGSPALLGLLGSVRMEQGRYEEALDAFTRGTLAAEGTPEQQALLFNQVVACEYLGDFSRARDLLAAYLEQYPGDEEAAREMQFLQTR